MDTTSMLESSCAVDKCYICLNPFENRAVASLDSCQHVFCLQCIVQWSKTANTCPVDRITFAFIYQRRCPGGDILKKIKVKTPKKDDDDDDEEEERYSVICERCGRSDRRHRLIVCRRCDSRYHMDCLTPSLNTEPDGDWVCPECIVVPQQTDVPVAVEEEISDGELTDLLNEADETAFTSSRLRPSTLNRHNNATEQRHSRRIRIRRTREDPDPQPQTSWHVPKYLLKTTTPVVTAEEVSALHHVDTSNSSLKTKIKRKRAT